MKRYYLTDEEIAHVLTLSHEDIYKMIYDMDYDDFYPYKNHFRILSYDKYSECNKYRSVEKRCAEIGGKLLLPDDKQDEWKKLEEEYKLYNDIAKIIYSTVYDKIENCEHEYEFYGHGGCYEDIELYRCKHCGKEVGNI